jgi:uncharacterized membrane protein
MRTLGFLLLMAAVVFSGAGLTGCKKETPKGGPGATTTTNATTTGSNPRPEDNTFSLKFPRSVSVEAGKSEEITITLKPGSAFNQSVKVTFDTPKGISITPSSATYKATDTDRKFTVAADAKVQPGDHTVTINGTPDTGTPTSETMTVTVKKPS